MSFKSNLYKIIKGAKCFNKINRARPSYLAFNYQLIHENNVLFTNKISNILLSDHQCRHYCNKTRTDTVNSAANKELTDLEYEQLSDKTLDLLTDIFETIFDSEEFKDKDVDVTYTSGVLTVNLGPKLGIYVINKQTPNKQIWLSSPISGPKRYDYVDGKWTYKYDGQTMNQLLREEFSKTFDSDYKIFDFD